mgnify:CR=1 FL=1
MIEILHFLHNLWYSKYLIIRGDIIDISKFVSLKASTSLAMFLLLFSRILYISRKLPENEILLCNYVQVIFSPRWNATIARARNTLSDLFRSCKIFAWQLRLESEDVYLDVGVGHRKGPEEAPQPLDVAALLKGLTNCGHLALCQPCHYHIMESS